jgi:hypothetical protein
MNHLEYWHTGQDTGLSAEQPHIACDAGLGQPRLLIRVVHGKDYGLKNLREQPIWRTAHTGLVDKRSKGACFVAGISHI